MVIRLTSESNRSCILWASIIRSATALSKCCVAGQPGLQEEVDLQRLDARTNVCCWEPDQRWHCSHRWCTRRCWPHCHSQPTDEAEMQICQVPTTKASLQAVWRRIVESDAEEEEEQQLFSPARPSQSMLIRRSLFNESSRSSLPRVQSSPLTHKPQHLTLRAFELLPRNPSLHPSSNRKPKKRTSMRRLPSTSQPMKKQARRYRLPKIMKRLLRWTNEGDPPGRKRIWIGKRLLRWINEGLVSFFFFLLISWKSLSYCLQVFFSLYTFVWILYFLDSKFNLWFSINVRWYNFLLILVLLWSSSSTHIFIFSFTIWFCST